MLAAYATMVMSQVQPAQEVRPIEHGLPIEMTMNATYAPRVISQVLPPQEVPIEHEHAHTLIFDASDSFDVESITYTVLMIIGFTLFWEKIVHYMRHKTHPYHHLYQMLEKILAELTILGFLSFTLTMLIQSGVLPENQILVSFEFSHVLIFFVACLLVIQGLNLAITSSAIKRNWAAAKNVDPTLLAANFKTQMGSPFFFLSKNYEQVRWRLLHKLFMRGQAATETGTKIIKIEKEAGFDFGMYLEMNLNELIVDIAEIESATWIFTALVGIIITGLYLAGGSIGHGDGVHEFCIIGYCGLLYTLVLLWIAFRSTSRFLQLLDIPDTNYSTLLDAYIYIQDQRQGQLARHAEAHPISPEQFQECFPMGSSSFFHVALDIGSMFNCLYCGLYVEHFMLRAISEGDMLMLVLMVLPPILGIFVLTPIIIKQYALLRAVAALEDVTLSNTIAYMKVRM
jgi:hypothetical protein